MLGNDFITRPAPYRHVCSECGHITNPGEDYQVSIKGGKVRKTLCMNEDCRMEFDNRIWQQLAQDNARRRAAHK
jgi:hypothetical protein